MTNTNVRHMGTAVRSAFGQLTTGPRIRVSTPAVMAAVPGAQGGVCPDHVGDDSTWGPPV